MEDVERRDRRRRVDNDGDNDDDDDRWRRRRQKQSGDDRGGGGTDGAGTGGRRPSRWAQVDAAADAADERRGRFDGEERGALEQQQRQQQPPPPSPPPPPPPQQPQFGLSGALAAETNTTAEGVTLLHAPPADAAPGGTGGTGGAASGGGATASGGGRRWRLFVFKAGRELEGAPEISLSGPASTFLFGRDRRVADVPTDHLSCSKQHAVIQFRRTSGTTKGGGGGFFDSKTAVSRPYLMDLGSTNGTFLNGERIEAQRYYELLPKDVVRFGESTREFVVLTEGSV